MICAICNKKFETIKSLQTHISHGHKINSKVYYDKYLKKEKEGICYCGKKTNYKSMSVGYHIYCSIKCQSNSKKVIDKRISKTCGSNHWMIKTGKGNPNKGKTYNEIHGEKKAKRLKHNLSIWFLENCTGENNPFFGKKHNSESREKISLARKGKTYEQIFGFEKGKKQRKKRSKIKKLEYTTFRYYSNFYDIKLRKKILLEQNYKCPICFSILKPYKKNLHHINYIKKDNRRRNLIYLCVGCHSTTNGNRPFWKSYLRKINREIIRIKKLPRRYLLLIEKTLKLNDREKIINRRIR